MTSPILRRCWRFERWPTRSPRWSNTDVSADVFNSADQWRRGWPVFIFAVNDTESRVLIPRQTAIPELVRVKAGALDRMGIYAERYGFRQILYIFSAGLDSQLLERLTASLPSRKIELLKKTQVEWGSFEATIELFRQSPGSADAVIGVGGGKALDVAKYIAFLLRLPYLSVPTSLSNAGFCCPQYI